MVSYVKDMIDDFPEKFKPTDTAMTLATEGLFHEGQSKKLDKDQAEAFHTSITKGLFMSK